MGLFQNSVVTKYLNSLDRQKTGASWAVFLEYFHNPEIRIVERG
jgi:hypothetical protein